MATVTKTKNYDSDRRVGYKLKQLTVNGKTVYAVLVYKTIFRFFKEFKMWSYVRDDKNQVRIFKDLRSATAYISYQTNPAMQK